MEERPATGVEAPRLPHKFPFVLIDRVVELEPGSQVVAVKNVGSADLAVAPGGEWPRVLLLEAMAQATGIAAAQPERPRAGVLAAVDRFRCAGVVRPGDRLWISARVVRRFGVLVRAHALVRSERARCAAAEITLALARANGG